MSDKDYAKIKFPMSVRQFFCSHGSWQYDDMDNGLKLFSCTRCGWKTYNKTEVK